MMRRRGLGLCAGALLALFVVVGCAPPFSKQLLERVDSTILFPALQEHPDTYKGKLVMIGGVIVESKNSREGTAIEILQKPLDGQGRPLQTDATGGRFIAVSDKFLDAAVYHAGRLITVIAEVAGSTTRPLGEIEYRYPVVTVKDLHLWEMSTGPRFNFGIGVFRQI